MAYFTYVEDSHYYRSEWQELVDHIKTEWPQSAAAHLGDLDHHIEAKALYIFTMSQGLIKGAENLARKGWKSAFIEALILLFPMLELIGEARLGNEPKSGSWRRLASGIDWLIDPSMFPHRSSRRLQDFSTDEGRIGTLGNYMDTLSTGPKVKELYHLRNYIIHGLKNQKPKWNFDIGAVKTCMNYELPFAIVEQSKMGLATYWRQLSNLDGNFSQEWVVRLAEADIYPFGILGSPLFGRGLIRPEIVYWLTNS